MVEIEDNLNNFLLLLLCCFVLESFKCFLSFIEDASFCVNIDSLTFSANRLQIKHSTVRSTLVFYKLLQAMMSLQLQLHTLVKELFLVKGFKFQPNKIIKYLSLLLLPLSSKQNEAEVQHSLSCNVRVCLLK